MSIVSEFIDRLMEEKLPEFVAPVTPATRWVVTKHKGVPYKYHRDNNLRGLTSGWHRLNPYGGGLIDKGEPETWEIDSYLELYKPRLTLIALYRLSGQSWLCYPFNESDAKQKSWVDGPVAVHLVSESIEPFDTVVSHGPLYNLVYRPTSVIENPRRKDFMNIAMNWDNSDKIYTTWEYSRSIAIIQAHIQESRIADAAQAKLDQMKTTEGKLKYYLGFLGAELLSWHDSGSDLVIRWRENGVTHSSRVSANMSVTSAGICLSGQDKQFNVAALVDVMREARELNRPGAHGPENDHED